MYCECLLLRGFVAVVEVVDELLDPHRLGFGQIAIHDEASSDSVGGRVNVHGEGREAVVLRIDERVDPIVLEEDQIIGSVVDGVRTTGSQRVRALGIRVRQLNSHQGS